MGEVVEDQRGSPLAVDGERQVRERVVDVGVAAVLGDEDVGPELPQQRRDDRVEGPEPPAVRRPGRQRDVDRAALGSPPADVLGRTRAREEQLPGLVEADREDVRVVPEHPLDAVAVVGVDVHVGDPTGAVVAEPADRDRDVVVDAEPARPVRHGVVQPTAHVRGVHDLSGPDPTGGLDARADHVGRGVVHAGEGRVVLGPEPARQVGPTGVLTGPAHRLDVLLAVDGADEVVVGHGRRDHREHARGGRPAVLGEEPELVGEPHREVDAHGVHRVGGTEVVVDEGAVEDHAPGTGHVTGPRPAPGTGPGPPPWR